MRGLDSMEGTKYKAEFFTDKIKISTPIEESVETVQIVQEKQEKTEQSEADIALGGENDEIPATVIHLDSPIVDLTDREDMFILVVKKAYVFIIPKRAFTEDECQRIRDKLSAIMGIRYKA